MNDLDALLALARYNRWMNGRLYTACAALEATERTRDRGAFFGSIERTLHHLVTADHLWLRRFVGAGLAPSWPTEWLALPITRLDEVLFDDFAHLHAHRQALDDAIVVWMTGFPRAALDTTFVYARLNGDRVCKPVRLALTHFFNHQTHHRGQVTTLLMQAGVDPGVTDLIALPDGE